MPSNHFDALNRAIQHFLEFAERASRHRDRGLVERDARTALTELKRAARDLLDFPPEAIRTPYSSLRGGNFTHHRTNCRERWLVDLKDAMEDLQRLADEYLEANLLVPPLRT